jgi:hypothetical protein
MIIVFFPFRQKKTDRVTAFHGHLMLHLPFKFDKNYMQLMAWHSTTP